jgi:hypothetical protein
MGAYLSGRLLYIMGESTLSLPKIVVTGIIFLQLNFLITYGHHILDYFTFKNYIWLGLDLI